MASVVADRPISLLLLATTPKLYGPTMHMLYFYHNTALLTGIQLTLWMG